MAAYRAACSNAYRAWSIKNRNS